MKLRRLNSSGIQEFRDFLDQCRHQPDREIPTGLLESDLLTEVVEPEIQISPQHFDTKGEAAQYLKMILSPLGDDRLTQDTGLWTWMSLLYFDSICRQANGKWLVRNDYMYIYEPSDARLSYRHLLFISWRVLQLAPMYNRLFLRAPLNILDKVTERVMARLYLTRIPCIFEVLDRLYWDEKRGRPRAGITGSKIQAGDFSHRFPLRIQQLEMTYDLMSLTGDQLIEILGDEFAFARPKTRRLFDKTMAAIE